MDSHRVEHGNRGLPWAAQHSRAHWPQPGPSPLPASASVTREHKSSKFLQQQVPLEEDGNQFPDVWAGSDASQQEPKGSVCFLCARAIPLQVP